jgi:hypothetical protein
MTLPLPLEHTTNKRKLLSKATFSTLNTTEMEVLTAVTVMISLLQYNAMAVRQSFTTYQRHPLASSSTLKMAVGSSES